ncbi:MAG: bis(5'-nucleosyl)-tetraphosphatase (symmetrical) [Gammaproteobacteria bacterium]|jgi:bis(5'-nucleosyl)-tetraphosphatase (symmetrical)
MSTYAIGDLQGCYSALRRLLDRIQFAPEDDKLWFCGDLVNRGPESLQCLQFIQSLGDSAVSVLGNHDLHLLALFHSGRVLKDTDSLYPLLKSEDCDSLMDWLQQMPLLHYDKKNRWVMSHAGIHPQWNLETALRLAGEVEAILQGAERNSFLSSMYGDLPDFWSEKLDGMERLRCITNVFTRMRFFHDDGRLNFEAKLDINAHKDQGLTAWFNNNLKLDPGLRIVFGHWSTLPVGQYGRAYALDAGCVWGGCMVALKIDHELEWFNVNCADGLP